MILWKPDALKRCAEKHGIAEQMLSILCHIIKGEKQLLEKFNQQNKQKEKTEKSALSEIQKTPAPTTFHIQVDVNETYLQQVYTPFILHLIIFNMLCMCAYSVYLFVYLI